MADERVSLTFVLDSGPVVALDRLGYGGTLARGLIGAGVIPTTVAEELQRGAPRPGALLAQRLKVIRTPEAALDGLVREYQVPASVHRGELGVIALTRALRIQDPPVDARAVIDDLPARKLAARAGLTPSSMTGTLGLLIAIHDAGLAAADLPQEVAALQHAGYRFSAALVQRALDIRPVVGEGRAGERSPRHVAAPIPHPRRRSASRNRGRSII